MVHLHLSVIPAQAGIHWLQELRDSRFRGSDDDCAFFDSLLVASGSRARVRARARTRVAPDRGRPPTLHIPLSVSNGSKKFEPQD